MVQKLLCKIVGEPEGVAVSVKIGENDSVASLVVEFANTVHYAGRVDKLWRRWAVRAVTLNEAGAPVLHDDNENPQGLEKMNTSLWISNDKHFGENFIPAEGQVHVLLVAPPAGVGSKRPADADPDDILKRLRNVEVNIKATDFENLFVSEDEFQLDSLPMTREPDTPIVMTPGLHEFWKEFGEFPPYYFVRTEEVVFWKVIKKMLFGEDRVVIVGSPGVAKSSFLMLIAFYLLVIHRLKQRQHKNAVVVFDGRGSYTRRLDLSSEYILAIRDQTKGAVVLFDGFNQAAVEGVQTDICSPFDFLATSCQFNAKQDDNARIVVLPAWRDVDLLQYAKVTN